MNRTFLMLAGVLALAAGVGSTSAQTTTTNPAEPSGQAQPVTPAPAPAAQPITAEPGGKPAAQEKSVPNDSEFVYVKISTTKGDFFLELNQAKAPITVKNFLNYVDKGFYTDTIFHRVIDKFMIQGGGLLKDLTVKQPDKAIKNEWQNGLKNVKWSVAMARTQLPDSAQAQFFINVVDNSFLDTPRPPDPAAYCVFGRVVGGTETLDKIRTVKTTPRGIHEAVPVDPVVITGTARVSKEEAFKGGSSDK